MSDKRDVRLHQAVLLLAGALFLVFVVAPVDGRFFWTPLTVGLAFLGAAVAGGRDGGYWAIACPLVGWGAAVVIAEAATPDLDVSGLYLAGAGIGAAAAVLLQRHGFAVEPLSLALTIAAGGLLLALTTTFAGVLDDARTYAAALGAVAVVELALAVMPAFEREARYE
jgi:hypothetical protein